MEGGRPPSPRPGAEGGPLLRIGTAPITWGVSEHPGWGEVLPYERVLEDMAALGYAGTELGPWGYLPRDPAALGRALRPRGLALIGAYCPVTLHDPARHAANVDRARETAAVLAALGAETLVLADAGDQRRLALAGRVPPDGSAGLDPSEWQRLAGGVDEIARGAAGQGLRTAFHPHAGTYVETPDETRRLLALTDPAVVGLCLDTGHVVYGGGDPVRLARDHAARVRHVHLKDVRPEVLERLRRERLDLPSAVGAGVFAPLGDGMVDIGGLLRALRAAGYDGWLVVEQDVRLSPGMGGDVPRENARRSLAHLRGLLGRKENTAA